MAIEHFNVLLGYIRRLAQASGESQTSDQELLVRFLEQRSEAAFAALVRRHAAMVLEVANRLLQNSHDAEDVFQATFLLLARKAGSLRKPGSVACWLHGVAHRLALQTRDARLSRSTHESRAATGASPDALADITLREAQAALDEELSRLSAKYRAPLLLCYLEGMTRDEAARQLHLSPATLKRRLLRGRDLLRSRLTQRGVTAATALSPLVLMEHAAQTGVPVSLLSSVVRAAPLVAANKPLGTGLVSVNATKLMEGMVRIMWIAKMQAAALYFAIAAAATGAGVVAHQAWAGKPSAPNAEQTSTVRAPNNVASGPERQEQIAPNEHEQPIKFSEGKNYLVSPITTELQRALLAPNFQSALAYVVLDGAALVRADGLIDTTGLDWETLRKSLIPAKGGKETMVVFNPIFHDPFPSDHTRDFIGWTLRGFGYDMKFGRAYVSLSMNGGFNWDKTRAVIAKRMAGKPDAAEPMTGNSAVHVYPVRTILSRYLTWNADCVIRFVAPFKGPSADKLDPEVEKAIRTYVSGLDLADKDSLNFQLGFKQDARQAVDRFAQTTAKRLAKELGFKESSVSQGYVP